MIPNKPIFVFTAVATALILCFSSAHAGDIAFIPYSVETIERDFPAESGKEYAKTVSVAAAVYKEIPSYSFKELDTDLTRLAIDPQSNISTPQIENLCKSRYLSYALLGRISKIGRTYHSRSVLYSLDRKGIVASADVKGSSMAECAAKEAEQIFSRFDDPRPVNTDYRETDIAVVIDTSYTMKPEWTGITDALTFLSSQIIDNQPGSRLHIIPFAEKFTLTTPLPPVETVPAMKQTLKNLNLKGGGTGKALSSAISFAIENIRWRDNRSIIIITNSSVAEPSLDRYALRAKQRNITVNTLSMGNCSLTDATVLKRLASITSGTHASVSYRQKSYDNKSNEYYLYMSESRLFQGETSDGRWIEGVLRRKTTGSSFVELPEFADEVSIKGGQKVSPYTMSDYFKKAGNRSLVGTGPLESNISNSISSISFALPAGKSLRMELARVLLSHGKNSLWVSVYQQKDLDFFARQKELGFASPVGVRIMLKPEEAFGMTFNPNQYYTGFDWESLPQNVRVTLDDVLKQPSYYAKNGMFSPPVWFINLRIDEIEYKKPRSDIRDLK